MEVLAIGHIVRVRVDWQTFEGPVVFIFSANIQPSQEDILKYYNLEPGDRHYKSACRTSKFDRAVIDKGNGHYIIVPVAPGFRGTCTIIGRIRK